MEEQKQPTEGSNDGSQEVVPHIDPVVRYQIEQRLSMGHSKKAEVAINKLTMGMKLDDVKSAEPSLRELSSKFLPKHKARHRRVEQLISQRLAAASARERSSPSPSRVESSLTQISACQSPSISVIQVQESEFRELVAEVRPLGFTRSEDVSSYILDHGLCGKYRHISGIVPMERDGDLWDFVGGISEVFFGRLCSALGLAHRHSTARPRGFISFDELGWPT